jgi:hypothetical protein
LQEIGTTAREAVELGGDLVGGQVVGAGLLLGERVVLVLGEEGPLVPEFEVHGVLDGRELVVVVPLGPGDPAPASIAAVGP